MEINEEVLSKVIKVAEELGIDVVDVIMSRISAKDPTTSIRFRMELAERFMGEAEEYLRKGDAVQASEKAYKAAEEIVKALAEKYNLPEHQQAMKEGRWHTYMLATAANALSRQLGRWVINGWSSAYVLHVWGFHEAKLSVESVGGYIDEIKEMLENARRVLSSS